MEQQADEPCHEEIDDGRHDEGEESVERARAYQVGGARHVGHSDVAHDARALQQTHHLALIDGHHRLDHLWQHYLEERLPWCKTQSQARLSLTTVDTLNGGA